MHFSSFFTVAILLVAVATTLIHAGNNAPQVITRPIQCADPLSSVPLPATNLVGGFTLANTNYLWACGTGSPFNIYRFDLGTWLNDLRLVATASPDASDAPAAVCSDGTNFGFFSYHQKGRVVVVELTASPSPTVVTLSPASSMLVVISCVYDSVSGYSFWGANRQIAPRMQKAHFDTSTKVWAWQQTYQCNDDSVQLFMSPDSSMVLGALRLQLVAWDPAADVAGQQAPTHSQAIATSAEATQIGGCSPQDPEGFFSFVIYCATVRPAGTAPVTAIIFKIDVAETPFTVTKLSLDAPSSTINFGYSFNYADPISGAIYIYFLSAPTAVAGARTVIARFNADEDVFEASLTATHDEIGGGHAMWPWKDPTSGTATSSGHLVAFSISHGARAFNRTIQAYDLTAMQMVDPGILCDKSAAAAPSTSTTTTRALTPAPTPVPPTTATTMPTTTTTTTTVPGPTFPPPVRIAFCSSATSSMPAGDTDPFMPGFYAANDLNLPSASNPARLYIYDLTNYRLGSILQSSVASPDGSDDTVSVACGNSAFALLAHRMYGRISVFDLRPSTTGFVTISSRSSSQNIVSCVVYDNSMISFWAGMDPNVGTAGISKGVWTSGVWTWTATYRTTTSDPQLFVVPRATNGLFWVTGSTFIAAYDATASATSSVTAATRTIQMDSAAQKIRGCSPKDPTGQSSQIIYCGTVPSNLATATDIAVIRLDTSDVQQATATRLTFPARLGMNAVESSISFLHRGSEQGVIVWLYGYSNIVPQAVARFNVATEEIEGAFQASNAGFGGGKAMYAWYAPTLSHVLGYGMASPTSSFGTTIAVFDLTAVKPIDGGSPLCPREVTAITPPPTTTTTAATTTTTTLAFASTTTNPAAAQTTSTTLLKPITTTATTTAAGTPPAPPKSTTATTTMPITSTASPPTTTMKQPTTTKQPTATTKPSTTTTTSRPQQPRRNRTKTISPMPPTPAPLILANPQLVPDPTASKSALASFGVLALSPGYVQYTRRNLDASGLARCGINSENDGEIVPEVGFDSNPLFLRIGDGPFQTQRGSIVSGAAMCVIVMAIAYAVAAVRARWKKEDLDSAQIGCKIPSVLNVPVGIFGPPAVGSASAMLAGYVVDSDRFGVSGTNDFLLILVAIVWAGVGPVLMLCAVAHLITTHERLEDASEEYNREAQRDLEGGSLLGRAWHWLCGFRRKWVSTDRTKRLAIFFDSWNQPWFAPIDYAAAALISIAAGASPICVSRQCCVGVSVLALVAALVHIFATLFWFPFIIRWESFSQPAMSFCTVLLSILGLVAIVTDDQDKLVTINSVSGVISSFSFVLGALCLIMALLMDAVVPLLNSVMKQFDAGNKRKIEKYVNKNNMNTHHLGDMLMMEEQQANHEDDDEGGELQEIPRVRRNNGREDDDDQALLLGHQHAAVVAVNTKNSSNGNNKRSGSASAPVAATPAVAATPQPKQQPAPKPVSSPRREKKTEHVPAAAAAALAASSKPQPQQQSQRSSSQHQQQREREPPQQQHQHNKRGSSAHRSSSVNNNTSNNKTSNTGNSESAAVRLANEQPHSEKRRRK